MSKRELAEAVALCVATMLLLLVCLRLARALATLLAWAFVAVQ